MQEQIQKWKEQYSRVVKLGFAGIDYYYRPLTIDEYMNIQKLVETDEDSNGEINVVKTAVLSPELKENLPAGVVIRLSDEILKISGFIPDGEPEEL